MLDFMRKNAQSWGVKLLFGLIVIVFVFWGVGSFRSDRASLLATVNDEPITLKEFNRAYENTLQDLRNRESGLDQEQIESMDLKKRVFNQLVSAALLGQKAREWGVTVPSDQLRKNIEQIQVFQDEEKRFSPERYEAVLKANRLTPAQFEQDQAHNLLMEKVRTYAGLPAEPDPEEVREFFDYARSRAKAEYIPFEWSDYRDQIKIQEEKIQEFYEQNKDRFQVPEKLEISYLEITPASLADAAAITDQEVADYFAEHKDNFSEPEKVRARHILIELPEDAPERSVNKARDKLAKVKSRLAAGEDFADLAREYSDGPSSVQGGDLGWFSRGSMVKPFEKAAFALKPGQVSDPVRTRFGLHLIKLEEHQPAGELSLEEAEDEIREEMARQRAADELADVIDTALEMLLTTGDLKEIAAELDLTMQKSAPFTRSAGPEGLDLPETAVNELFSMSEGEVTESPILLDQGYVLARVEKKIPSRPQDLEKVRPQIKSTLTRRAAMDIAEQEAKKALELLLSEPENIPSEFEDKLQKTGEFGRRGAIPGLGMNPDLVQNLFDAKVGSWLDEPFEVDSGYVLVRPTEQLRPDSADFEAQKQFWISTYARMERQQYLDAFVQGLREDADIELVNPRVLEY
ncbi:MAG: SurA N-terminal domain-containing protein [Desulfonatronovibrionaceae bacterium]